MKLTKRMLYASNPYALVDSANAVRGGDGAFASELETVVSGVRTAGESWAGSAHDAAYDCVSGERDAGAKLSDEVIELADVMSNAGNELVAWRDALIGKIGGAETDGCVVNDDWLVVHDDSTVATEHQTVINEGVLNYCVAAANAAAHISTITSEIRECGNRIGDPDGALVDDPGSASGSSSGEGPTDLLPGTPIPVTDGAEIRDPFGTTRIVPGQTVPAGFADPNMTSPLADQFGKRIEIDPSRTPGAVGGYSGNTLTPNPMTNMTGIGVPGVDAGKMSPKGVPTRVPGSIDIDAEKGATLRIVAAEPYAMSTVDYGGQPELAVHYRYEYQVRNTHTFVNHAIIDEGDWVDVSPEEVQELAKRGVPVPRLD